MIKRDLISIIVPVYNTMEYLKECLDSLKNQSYENLEIIMVNDGSTDNSGMLCREYCEKDSRFFLIEQENQGLSMSRNAGVKKATGKYICFVDSDDFVHEKYVEILYKNLINYHADVSMCGYMKFREGQKTEKNICNVCSNMSRLEMLYAITTTGPDNSSEKIVVSWNKMIRADIMKQLRFVNKLHEDEYMINELLLNITHAVWTEAILYFYRQHSDSITGMKNKTDIRHLEVLGALYNRLILFSGAEYRTVFPELLRSYFDNSAAVYYSVLSSDNKGQLLRRIYPQYLYLLLKYAEKLTIKQFLRYLLFLAAPAYYRKKYLL